MRVWRVCEGVYVWVSVGGVTVKVVRVRGMACE